MTNRMGENITHVSLLSCDAQNQNSPRSSDSVSTRITHEEISTDLAEEMERFNVPPAPDVDKGPEVMVTNKDEV